MVRSHTSENDSGDSSDRVTDGGVDVEPDLLLEYDHRELSTFALVPCSATKNPGRLPAREKYAGSLFKKARDYAEEIADGYAILSGKYGAIAPYLEIEDYDVSVRDRDAGRWGAEVVEDLDLPVDPYGLDRLVVLAGAAYREPISDWFADLEDAGVTVEVPLEGLRIGEQMSELNHRLEEIKDAFECFNCGRKVGHGGELPGYAYGPQDEIYCPGCYRSIFGDDEDSEVATDGGLPFAEEDVMVRRARLEPGLGDEADDVDEDPEPIADGGSEAGGSERPPAYEEVFCGCEYPTETGDYLPNGREKCGECGRPIFRERDNKNKDNDQDLVTDGGQIELPEEINGWSLAFEAVSSVRYEGDLVTVEIFGHKSGFDLKYGSPHTFQSLTLEDGIEDRESAIDRLLSVVEERTPEEAGEHIERLQSDGEYDEADSEAEVDSPGEDFQTAAEIEADGAGDVVAELEVRGLDEETRSERRAVVRSVLEYIKQHGSAGKSEIESEILEDQRGGYKTTLAAWKHLVRPGLADLSEQLDELERPRAGESWSWSEPDDEDQDADEGHGTFAASVTGLDEDRVDVESLLDQIDALETGDVIRLEGYSDGEDVETVELEIVASGPRRLTVLSESGDRYDVEEVKDGVIGTIGRELGNLVVTSIRLVVSRRRELDEEKIVEEADELEREIEEGLREEIGSLEGGDVVEVTYRSVANGNDLEVTGDVLSIEGEDSPPIYRDVVLQDESEDREIVLMREDLELATRGWQGDRKIGDVLGVRVVNDGLDIYPDQPEQAQLESDADKRGPGELLAEMADESPDRADAVSRAAREIVAEDLKELVESGLTAAQALDYWFTEEAEGTYGQLSQSEWSEYRNTSPQAINDSVRKARQALEDEEG